MKRFTLAILALGLFLASAFAQSNTGRLVGTVSDPSGVIPGATVTVTDVKTGKERTVVASDDGTFAIPQLEVGSYTVKITAGGHKTFTATDVKIDVGRDYTLNPVMEVGDINESVTVVGGADVINSSSAELSNTVSTRQIQDLPLNGRDPTALLTLQAGTASNGATNTSVNGQRSSFTNITRDGINIQDNFIRANASDFSVERPNTDDVAEFTVTTQNASADQGYGASQIQFVTPRGQNQWSGAIYEYNRNSKFSANDFFSNTVLGPGGTPAQKTFLNRNQFGGRLSGPIIKNKIFFFYGNETLMRRTVSSRLRTVLTPAARSGIFTYIDNSGAVRQVNIFSVPKTAGVGGVAVPSAIDPTIQSRFLSIMPTGNSTETGDQLNTTGYRFNQRQNLNRFTNTTRIDYDVNAKNTINGVFSFTRENPNDRPDVDNPQGYGSVPVTNQPADRKFLSLAWRTSPTAAITNELRGGFFMSNPIFLRTTPEPSFFLVAPSLISNPEVTFEPQGRISNTYTIQDNADWLKGNHSIRFGGQTQFFRINSFASFTTVPNFTLGTGTNTPQIATATFTSASIFPGGISTTQRTTANQLFALLGGVVASGTQTFNVQNVGGGFEPGPSRQIYDYETVAFYAADQWRVRPTLTLNYGLRYELFTPLREERGLLLAPVVQNPKSLSTEQYIQALESPNGSVDFIRNINGGNNLFFTDKNNLGPVVSFAWAPQFENKFLGRLFGDSGRTVIRGGYRISYVNDEFVRAPDNAETGNAGLSTSVSALGPTGTSSLNARVGNVPSITTPTFTGSIPATFFQRNNPGPAGNFFNTVFGVDPNIKVPMTQEWNFGIQRELGFQTALEVRYVGGKSDNLIRGIDLNQIEIRQNGFLADFIRAQSNLALSGGASGAFNPAIPGSQPLTVFPLLPGGGFLNDPTVIGQLTNGTPADLAVVYITNGINGPIPFRANGNAGAVDVLFNGGKYRYNSLQVELRRRFAQGLYFQTNYTFQKTLTNASGVGQTNFEPNLDNANPQLEYARADYDQTHVFNFNGIYELPFGKGKRWLNSGGVTDRVFGGWQITSIIRASTGAPLTIVDQRATVNRAARTFRQTAISSISQEQIKSLIGVYRTPCGVFYINPSVIDINLSNCSGTRRASRGYGTAAFPGQVFFNNGPGQEGNLSRFFINGPFYFNWDASLIKNIALTERVRLQLRFEAFNVLNRANFFGGQPTSTSAAGIFNINSANFGRLTTTFDPRIVQFAGRIEF